MRSALIALLVLARPGPDARAEAPQGDAAEVRAVIESSVNSALAVLKSKGLAKAARKKKVMDIVYPAIDFALMAKLTMGRKHWSGLDEKQKKDFVELFVKRLEDSYYEKIDLLTDETVEFDAPKATEKGKYQMMTDVLSKGERHKMLYKLYKKGETWKVYDVEINGISLVRSYGAQYDQFLQRGTVEELLKRLRDKTLDQPEDLKAKKEKAGAKENP